MTYDRTPAESNAAVESRYEEYVMPIWKDLDVPLRRGAGTTVEDFDGEEYLDCFAGISVVNAGHTNEAVVEAATEQLETFVHGCSYLHPNQPMADLAETIATITPGALQKTFFGNSGTEAVEGAIKLARKYTGAKEIVGLEMGFHGRTLGSLALTGNKAYKADMAPTINDVAHTLPPYSYRCPICEGDGCDAECANVLEQTIGTHTADDLAAVVVEPLMGEGGLIVPEESWLERVEEITDDHDALLVVDEVQTGYGRTGDLFAIEQYDVEPDVLCQAKGIANGLPLGAFTASAEVADAFESGDHLSTFGGNPVACAAALASIEEIRGKLLENARERGQWLGNALADLAADHAIVGDARGRGLMYGLELVDPSAGTGPLGVAPAPADEMAKHVSHALRDEGIVVGVGGYFGNVVRIQPPLSIDRSELERLVDALETAIAAEADEVAA